MNPRQQRLLNDHNDMLDLKARSGGILNFEVSNNYQHYDIIIDGIETLVGANGIQHKRYHAFTVDLPPEYPIQQPIVKFKETIFHPNWYRDGKVCYGLQWVPGNKLFELVIDTIKMMTFDLVNIRSPANSDAKEWYLQNKQNIRNIIPKVEFPPPSKEDLDFYEGDLELL